MGEREQLIAPGPLPGRGFGVVLWIDGSDSGGSPRWAFLHIASITAKVVEAAPAEYIASSSRADSSASWARAAARIPLPSGRAACISFTARVRGPFFWVLRISGRLLGGVVGGCTFAAKFGRQVLPGKRREDAVLYARWEILWPLVDSLVGHADGGGGGGGSAAQQFNGF